MLRLTREDGNVREFRLDDGGAIAIVLADDGSRIDVRTDDGQEIGHADLCEHDGVYRLTWMFLDRAGPQFKHRGLGREALRFHKDYFGCPIIAADNDGIRRADGSHLTGDAPGFVAKMRAEGIIEPGSFDEP